MKMNKEICKCAGCERQRLNLGGYQPCSRNVNKDISASKSPPKKP